MSNQLQASQIKWKRLRKLVFTTLFIGGAGGFAIYALGGGSLMLDADGLVTSQTVAVASPWPDARIREISVRPGDWVEAGQKIAVVDSAAMSRSLADLAAEQARVIGRVAQLEARREVVNALIPMAKVAAEDTKAFLDRLQKANSKGLVVARSLQQMSTAQVQAMDKLLSLEAEKRSLETEIAANQSALQQVSIAYDDLKRTYGSGELVAPASGYVGSHVGMVGEVLSGGTTPVANIYAGTSYVLAYIPENYLFDVDEGQRVSVKGRSSTATGYIERVLPVTDALPPEFQLPNRVRGRGQLVRVELSEPRDFALDEKVRLTSCYAENCGLGISEIIEAAIPDFLRGGNRSVAAAEQQDPAVPLVRKRPSTGPDVPVGQLYPEPAARVMGAVKRPELPATGIAEEPAGIDGPVTGSTPKPPRAPVTGSLPERVRTGTGPRT